MTQTMTIFAVPDACCAHCREPIQAELRAQPGVADVRVDVRGRIVHVTHDAETAPVRVLADLLGRRGYPVAGSSEAA